MQYFTLLTQSKRHLLFFIIGAITLSCGGEKCPSILGMKAGDSDDEIDFGRIPEELRSVIARTREKRRHYQQKEEESLQEVEEATQALEEQKQKNIDETAQLREELTADMLQRGIPLEEITAALGDPDDSREEAYLSQRERLLQEIRERGMTQEMKEQRRMMQRELKSILGNNYLGPEAWSRLGVTVNENELPSVSEELLQKVREMQTKGEQPILLLDVGLSLESLEEQSNSEGITLFSTEHGGDTLLRAEACYRKTVPCKRWLLLAGSDYGVLPGSRKKSYVDQVRYMEVNYPGFEVGGVRELVALYLLDQLQPGTHLFPEGPYTFGRVKEEYQTGEWKGKRIVLESGDPSGLVVYHSGEHAWWDSSSGLCRYSGLFCWFRD